MVMVDLLRTELRAVLAGRLGLILAALDRMGLVQVVVVQERLVRLAMVVSVGQELHLTPLTVRVAVEAAAVGIMMLLVLVVLAQEAAYTVAGVEVVDQLVVLRHLELLVLENKG